ncbi:thioredoxin reductase [Herbihabitans rhizosphaerae]|uniref:Thioredoxin reductase n=1 Tax=Herbihabitans rhizosphaerae TaxID=1872711 RepID=A0A4V2EU74_9PSEU|nr:thioredoxin reductase [Herbihabitans rhizosphaerae]
MGEPVVIVGAGPVGLAAAAHVLERGLEPLVLEAGDAAGAAVREWGHVRLFSRWAELVDEAAARLLASTGWVRPAGDVYPTGGQWVDQYLGPLAAALGERVRFGAVVTGVARRGWDRVVDAGREDEPFTVHLTGAGRGGQELITARAVIDASGTWNSPSPAGADGLPAVGEAAAGERISYRVPDFGDDVTRARYLGKHTVVVGRGHSALTALIQLARLSEQDGATRVSWVLRRGLSPNTFGSGESDQLAQRGALGLRARQAVDAGTVEVVTGFRTAAVESTVDAVTLVSEEGARIEGVDEVVVLTGFRPDLGFLSEVRLDLDPTLQAPVKLAPLIDPNVHSCGTVRPHGVVELAHPEPGLFVAGMKSYGRAPTFLALTGYEQVRSIAADLAGDRASAERVELVLEATA